MEKYTENAVAIKTKAFEFDNIRCHPSLGNRRLSMLGKRDQNLLKANTEKPIFIVSNNREIINQKQRVIHPQVQIYHDVKQNFSQSKVSLL